jgi:signal transduction histidine kinase
MRPLDPLSSIKFKLGVIIVAAVAVTVVVHSLGLRAELPLAMVGAVAAGVALAVVQVLARGMTSPLREMAAAARAMARGDYSRRVSRDEVGELARAFNAMAAELGETDRLRRDLVANVSHELRTPITALQAALENIVDGVEPTDPEALRAMLSQVERLGRLVEQLLDLSRLEAGVAPLEPRRFELEPLLDRVVEECAMRSRHAGGPDVTVDVHVEPRGLQVDGDPERVHQVVGNLLDNAIRHSPEEGRVTVAAASLDDAGVRIDVADQGPGIAPEDRERVFERFYRADAARASQDGGTGLGLSIARWIVELHGGDIRVEANRPHGTRLVVAFPRSDG